MVRCTLMLVLGIVGTLLAAPLMAQATQLVITQQPTNTVAGATITPALTVEARDVGNVLDATYTSNVTVALFSGTGTLSGTTTVAAIAGVATFNNLSINLAGAKTLRFTSGALTLADSSSFTISAAADNQLAITQQPTNTVAGATITPAITVEIQDQFGNLTASTANVTVALLTGTGTLSGTTTVAAVAGVATFNDLSINLIGAKTLRFTSTGLTLADSSSFTISAAADNQLAITQQPTNTVAGATITPAIAVEIRDQFGNLTTSIANVAVALLTGTGTLSGTTTVAAVAGVATFNNLSINLIGAKTLRFTSTGLTQADSSSFTISAAADNQLAFTQQPTNTAPAATITPAITVEIRDQFGNLTASTANVTIAIGTNPSAGTLSGTATQAAVAGVATFNNLSINNAGTGYTLDATSAGLTGATSNAFNITSAGATQLVITQQPTNTVAGATITPALTVEARDVGNVLDATYTSNVTVALFSGTGTLSGTTTVAAVAGVATFNNLSINLAGAKTLRFTSGALTLADSSSFTISAAAASALAFVQQPTTAAAGATIAPAITVAIRDAFGNQTTSTANVTIAIGTNPGSGTLSGTATQAAVSGLATFANLSINNAGTGYTLAATSTGVTGATSATFNITAVVTGSITVLSPNGGESRVINSGALITWTNGGGFTGNVDILLSTDSGGTFPNTVVSNFSNNGFYNWTVPNLPTATARIRVRATGTGTPTDDSNANFTIVAGTLGGVVGNAGGVDGAQTTSPGKSRDGLHFQVSNDALSPAAFTITSIRISIATNDNASNFAISHLAGVRLQNGNGSNLETVLNGGTGWSVAGTTVTVTFGSVTPLSSNVPVGGTLDFYVELFFTSVTVIGIPSPAFACSIDNTAGTALNGGGTTNYPGVVAGGSITLVSSIPGDDFDDTDDSDSTFSCSAAEGDAWSVSLLALMAAMMVALAVRRGRRASGRR